MALKDATGDPPAAASLLAQADFDLYSGDDACMLPLLAVGAVGVVGTTTHWTAPLFASMIAAMRRGELAQARAINAQLQPSFEYVNNDECVFPMAIKALLPLLGVEAGACRLPLPPAPQGTQERARAVCGGLGLA